MLSYRGNTIVTWSALGLELSDVVIGKQARITNAVQKKHAEKFAWPLGKNEFVENNYSELNLSCCSGPVKAAGLQDWKGSIRLDFLTEGKKYTATVYEDSPDGSISKRSITVNKGSSFPFEIKVKGGLAMIIQQ